MQPTVALTIAGSDSGGGAGIQADLHSFAASGVFGTTAITAITAQNTVGVQQVTPLPVETVLAQINSVLDDFPVRAIKTGMLGTPEIVRAVAERLRQVGSLPLVVDPVLISTTGASLLSEGGIEAYRKDLLERATVVTPNRDELAALLDRPASSIQNTEELRLAAIELSLRTSTTVVAKGGHLTPVAGRVVDLVVNGESVRSLAQSFVATPNDHGTGCSFAASLTARLSLGEPLDRAIDGAQRFVHSALLGAANWTLGSGRGPIDHHGWNTESNAAESVS
ncbi:MAG: bifunctional hydroxymethylpyrimidine kinase/phosphomethylpyrimidine kinase [Actinomycetota bacterium]